MDDRDPATVRTDLVVDQVNLLLAKIDSLIQADRGHTQTVIHKTAGIGPWAAAAVTACFCTLFGLILLSLEVHDLKAWSDVLRGRVTKLETFHQPEKKP